MSASPLSAGGLVLEIAGAIELASAYAFKRPRDIRIEATTYAGYNGALLISLAKQSADAWVGGTLLVLGFAAQFESALGATISSVYVTVPVAIVLALGAHIALHAWLRPWNVRRVLADIDAVQQSSDDLASALRELNRKQGPDAQQGERPSDTEQDELEEVDT